ncbi:ATP-binding protein, partial [Streptomyces sp. NPDC056002]|uniref:ATP-binding protein n=1 Tax=Streptomyces sp. NPDC056002 TaxID=3345675 RepID=UPI0035D72DDD
MLSPSGGRLSDGSQAVSALPPREPQGDASDVAAQKNNAPSEYGADSIKVLEGLEAVRKRPGMYIGSTGERGLHHLIWEVVDNAVDEAMAGFASRVDVRILADGGVQVTDDGRGIPVAMHATGIPTVDVVMTVLHAGGKFEEGAYQVSGGLHGVGVSVVNALSTRLEADIRTDGYEWFQTYERSVPGTLKQGEKTKETGTTIRFWADPDVFETTVYDFETIARRLQEMAFLNKGLKISLTDERHNEVDDDDVQIDEDEATEWKPRT